MADDHKNNDQTQSYAVLAQGTIVGHYRIIEKIGAGGMGEVFLAADTKLNRKVALKFMPPKYLADSDAKARFKREAQAAAGLTHENIVHIYEVAEYKGRPYFAMEMVSGCSLRELIKKDEIPLHRTLGFIRQIGQG
ncbi:MAG: protein kinase, partial [Planctomycetes bacterium]|nr:protein kinase [Planctomycetota bacterium]